MAMLDLVYIIVVTAVLNTGSVSLDGVAVGEVYPPSKIVERPATVHQTVFSSSSLGGVRDLFLKTKPILEKMVPGSRAVPTCYEVALKLGTVREIPCP